MRTPTWQEVEEFLRIDGWELIRTTGHSFYRKVLPDGIVLRTHASLAGDKTMSAGRFALILRTQLKVSPDDFWEALRTGRSVTRPAPALPTTPPAIPAWVVIALRHQLGKSEDEIAGLSPEEAERLVLEHWSRPAGWSDARCQRSSSRGCGRRKECVFRDLRLRRLAYTGVRRIAR